MARMPITYNGTNTDNLFVMGWKNGKEVKLKVKTLSCHGGIILDSIDHNEDESISGLMYGTDYKTYENLYNDRENLVDNTLYSVSDKGTVEQYIFKDKKLTQVSGAINETADNVPDIIENGIIEYNMPELVNGDYRYKGHKELTTVICDMTSLKSGYQMFMGTSLVGFCGDLSALEDGRDMFKGCQLDEASIINIINGIPDYSTTETMHYLTISYGSEVTDELIEEMTKEALAKNWEVEWIAYNV